MRQSSTEICIGSQLNMCGIKNSSRQILNCSMIFAYLYEDLTLLKRDFFYFYEMISKIAKLLEIWRVWRSLNFLNTKATENLREKGIFG